MITRERKRMRARVCVCMCVRYALNYELNIYIAYVL